MFVVRFFMSPRDDLFLYFGTINIPICVIIDLIVDRRLYQDEGEGDIWLLLVLRNKRYKI